MQEPLPTFKPLTYVPTQGFLCDRPQGRVRPKSAFLESLDLTSKIQGLTKPIA